jgi:hypothetical protein
MNRSSSRPGLRQAVASGLRLATSGTGLARPGSVPNWPALTCFTANGCAARTAASTRGEELRTAYAMLDEIGMEAFDERARRELLATGETARKRTAPAADQGGQPPTAQETQVALLARDGLTNPEIGARLFISPSCLALSAELRQGHLPQLAVAAPVPVAAVDAWCALRRRPARSWDVLQCPSVARDSGVPGKDRARGSERTGMWNLRRLIMT